MGREHRKSQPEPAQEDLKAEEKRRRGIAKPMRRYWSGFIKTPKSSSTPGEVLAVAVTRLARLGSD